MSRLDGVLLVLAAAPFGWVVGYVLAALWIRYVLGEREMGGSTRR